LRDLGKIATDILATGNGWTIADVVCTHGPQDRSFEEQHTSISITVVIEGFFQYRSTYGSELMSPGSLLLGNLGQSFECGHDHRAGDRCVAFLYAPEFFERASLANTFPTQRIPAIADLSPLIVHARQAIGNPDGIGLKELAYALPAAVLEILRSSRQLTLSPSAADERRISAALRFIEANLREPLPLELLASTAKMSEFHFLRTFKQVMQVSPHQYILRARLRNAAVQLKTRRDKVLEVALDSGFGDLSNFNHAFRAEFGVSPTQFRTRV
jgi:AraC family transcriptional regulator